MEKSLLRGRGKCAADTTSFVISLCADTDMCHFLLVDQTMNQTTSNQASSNRICWTTASCYHEVLKCWVGGGQAPSPPEETSFRCAFGFVRFFVHPYSTSTVLLSTEPSCPWKNKKFVRSLCSSNVILVRNKTLVRSLCSRTVILVRLAGSTSEVCSRMEWNRNRSIQHMFNRNRSFVIYVYFNHRHWFIYSRELDSFVDSLV